MPAYDHVHAFVQDLLRGERTAKVVGPSIDKKLEKVVFALQATRLDDSLKNSVDLRTHLVMPCELSRQLEPLSQVRVHDLPDRDAFAFPLKRLGMKSSGLLQRFGSW